MNDNQSKALIEEVESVKKLLILQLLAIGYRQKQIASALGVSEATLSRMLPKGLSKEIPQKGARKIRAGIDAE